MYGYLTHHGIKGQKWGIRKYQNPDGSLTAEGKARYNVGTLQSMNGGIINLNKGKNNEYKVYRGLSAGKQYNKEAKRIRKAMIKDQKAAKRSGEITKQEFKNYKAATRSAVDKMLTKNLGKEASEYAVYQKLVDNLVTKPMVGIGAMSVGILAAPFILGAVNDKING